MGQRLVFFDDLTGEEGDDVLRRTFALGSTTYAIDMSEENYKKLTEALQPFVDKAQPMKGKKAAPTSASPSTVEDPRLRPGAVHSKEDIAGLREFCAKHNLRYGTGRQPAALWRAFYANDPGLAPKSHRLDEEAA